MEMNWLLKRFVNGPLWSTLLKLIFLPRLKKIISNEAFASKSILEIGCGVGVSTLVFQKWFPDVLITAVDYDEEEIKLAKNQLKAFQSIALLKADATELPFASDSFDVVIETNTFHHIKDWQKAIFEVGRVLRPGGIFFVMDEAKSFLRFPLMRAFDRPESLFTVEEFAQALGSAKMEVEEVRGKGIFYITARKL